MLPLMLQMDWQDPPLQVAQLHYKANLQYKVAAGAAWRRKWSYVPAFTTMTSVARYLAAAPSPAGCTVLFSLAGTIESADFWKSFNMLKCHRCSGCKHMLADAATIAEFAQKK
jgi:hypothetical protein